MERDPFGERIICFICDYGLVMLAILAVIGVAGWRWSAGAATIHLPFFSTPTSTPSPTPLPTVTATMTTQPTATPLVTSTPTPPPKPEFVLVFLPLDWQASRAEFERVAQMQANTFITESGMDQYFTIQTVLLDTGLENMALDSEELAYDVLEYGLSQTAGDRYIGLTDGDLRPEGNSDIVGWVAGEQSMVVEAGDLYITAHELGHTFGLCDEYSFTEWSRQNDALSSGCPNPYPVDCPRVQSGDVVCAGAPTTDGRNSIMGPAGMYGAYGFNQACLTHLSEIFHELATQVIP